MLSNNAVFSHQSSIPVSAVPSKKWALPVAIALIWVGTSCIAIATKCLLTDKKCTRWGPEQGAQFPHPLTIAAVNLSIVGSGLLLLLTLRDVVIARRKPRLFSWDKFRVCLPVGFAFGLKILIGLAALRETPTEVYMLFHAINIIFIALAARILVGEEPTCFGEYIALLGVAVGSAISTSRSFFGNENGVGLIPFLLNICNGIFAGAVVATLRWTTPQMNMMDISIAEVTNLQILIGAVVVLPMTLLIDGGMIFTINTHQLQWLLISSAIMLVYHLALTLVCSLTSSLSVGIIEAVKPLPAFIVVAVVQKLPESNFLFWLGTSITLASSIYYKISRTMHTKGLRRSGSRQCLLASSNPLSRNCEEK
eukprot:CCRYP_020913-RA/>CCRYP_020913-RA protein AED:0.36 eAED:0.36 QI:0/-1/0/1/-1/1/1/0/365